MSIQRGKITRKSLFGGEPISSSGQSFSPLDIAGLEYWFDAKDPSTVTYNVTTKQISQWDDKSGNGRDIVQATSANQPLYDDVNFRINSTALANQFLSRVNAVSLTNMTIFFVAELIGTYTPVVNASYASCDVNATAGSWQLSQSGNPPYDQSAYYYNYASGAGTEIFFYKAPATTPTDQRIYFTAKMQPTRLDTWDGLTLKESVTGLTNPASATGTLRIGTNRGGSSSAQAYWYEVLIYNTALSDTDRETVINYLQARHS